MAQYSLAVALFDFVPVAVCAAALAALAAGIGARRPALAPLAWTGAMLVPKGGQCKASWKLLIAAGHAPIAWLENLLFIALAPGFTALALAMHHAVRPAAASAAAASVPTARVLAWIALPLGVAALLALALPGRAWFAWLIAVTTVANGALVVHAIRASRASGLAWPAPASFAASFAATLALAGLARLPDSEAAAWVQETVNLGAQAALAAGAWKLSRILRGADARTNA